MKWLSFDYAIADFGAIKRRGAVYVIYCDGRAIYVGQSGDAWKRIASYQIRFSYGSGIITPWGVFRSVKIKVSYGKRFGDWAMREIRLIRRLKPIQNCVGSVRRRAANRKEASHGG